jgi:hypothetical protein
VNAARWIVPQMGSVGAFILFGAVLGPLFDTIPVGLAVLLALVVLVVVRPLALEAVLLRARMSRMGRAFIAWFGPRGLSALLLALLVVEAQVPGATGLLAVTGVVVLVSVLVHGVTATPAARWYGEQVARAAQTPPEERESAAAGLFRDEATEEPRISPEELHTLLVGLNPPVVLDVRARGQYAVADGQIPGSVGVPPDQVCDWARLWTAQADLASAAQDHAAKDPTHQLIISPIAPDPRRPAAPVWRVSCARWALVLACWRAAIGPGRRPTTSSRQSPPRRCKPWLGVALCYVVYCSYESTSEGAGKLGRLPAPFVL